jgi:hypothetical protein
LFVSSQKVLPQVILFGKQCQVWESGVIDISPLFFCQGFIKSLKTIIQSLSWFISLESLNPAFILNSTDSIWIQAHDILAR